MTAASSSRHFPGKEDTYRFWAIFRQFLAFGGAACWLEIEWLHKPRVGGSIPPAATSENAMPIAPNASYLLLALSEIARRLFRGIELDP